MRCISATQILNLSGRRKELYICRENMQLMLSIQDKRFPQSFTLILSTDMNRMRRNKNCEKWQCKRLGRKCRFEFEKHKKKNYQLIKWLYIESKLSQDEYPTNWLLNLKQLQPKLEVVG
jgi:hypothetical protein